MLDPKNLEGLEYVKGLLRGLGKETSGKVCLDARRQPSFRMSDVRNVQQVDARGMTHNEVKGDQNNNVQITINFNHNSSHNVVEPVVCEAIILLF